MTRSKPGLSPVWAGLLDGLPGPGVVTLIGGGGKTSLMYYLAAGLKARGGAAFAAATARLFAPERPGHKAVLVRSLAELRRAVAAWRGAPELVTLAREAVPGVANKLAGLAPAWLDAVAAEYPGVAFIVEGDGSAGLPLKGHLAHDPVVPKSTKLLVPVIGAEAVGRPLTAEYVHRPARAAELAGLKPDGIVTVEAAVRLLLHPEGYMHNCPAGCSVVPFVNKAEGAASQVAANLAEAILAAGHPAVRGVVTGSIHAGEYAFFPAEEK